MTVDGGVVVVEVVGGGGRVGGVFSRMLHIPIIAILFEYNELILHILEFPSSPSIQIL